VTGKIVSISLFLVLPALWPSALPAQTPTASTALVAERHSENQPAGSTTPDRPVAAERNPRYRINRDDIVSLSFPLSPEFNQAKVTVQPDGYLTLLGVPAIHVQGLTVPEMIEAIKKAYSKTLHDPIVDVDLIDFQRAYFVALGQVAKPGQYDLRYDMTVTEAIAVAGGFAPTAKTQVFLYHRGNGGWVEAKELKMKDILHGKNVEEDISMRPGDMIFVPEKTITKVRKYVPYGFGVGYNLGVL
jgi:protein involved in polysaccharide export with SLBB domain